MRYAAIMMLAFISQGCGSTGTEPEEGVAPLQREDTPRFEAVRADTVLARGHSVVWR